MADEKRPPWFKLYGRDADILEGAKSKDVGDAVKAAVRYLNSGQLPEQMTTVQTLIFSKLRTSVDDAVADYKAKCKRAEAARSVKSSKGQSEIKPTSRKDQSEIKRNSDIRLTSSKGQDRRRRRSKISKDILPSSDKGDRETLKGVSPIPQGEPEFEYVPETDPETGEVYYVREVKDDGVAD